MKKHIQPFIELWDIPSGSIVGFFTVLIIGICAHAYVVKGEIPASVVTVYQFVIASFAGSKAVKTIWGKAQVEEKKPE